MITGTHVNRIGTAAEAESPLHGRLRLGISRCLLGEEVRFAGGHRRDRFLTDTLGPYVEWVPVCPEVEVGLGTPREAMRLTGSAEAPRLITIKSGTDHTDAMIRYAEQRVRELQALDLAGYVFKKDSPSCGMERVRIYNRHGMPGRLGVGLFARAFMDHFPLIAVEEEGRLTDPRIRENFIERVFCYRRWRDLLEGRPSRKAVVEFHMRHKYLLMAHSRPHYLALGRLVAQADRYMPRELADRYETIFPEALKVKATLRKHVNVLSHIWPCFKEHLSPAEKQELMGLIDEYHKGLVPLVVPLTLIKHYVTVFDVPYIKDQVYLNPHPKELMLRTHV